MLGGGDRDWTRRGFLAALATAVVARPAEAADLDGFLDLSARLCAVPRARLDRTLGARYLGALSAWARPADFRNPGPALEEAILEAWFSGIVETPGGLKVLERRTLAWDALPHAAPPGFCGR